MSEESEPEEELPPFMLEGARSGRSKCKTCRKAIPKGDLRLGILVEGPYGTGYMWHHLKCAARKQFERVEEAYAAEAWQFAKEEVEEVPPLEELKLLKEAADEKAKQKRELPYAQVSPSGRSSCKHCDELIPKDDLRVVLGRAVTFGTQTRVSPIFVLAEHVADALQAEDCATESDGFFEALRANSEDLSAQQLDALVERIGEL